MGFATLRVSGFLLLNWKYCYPRKIQKVTNAATSINIDVATLSFFFSYPVDEAGGATYVTIFTLLFDYAIQV